MSWRGCDEIRQRINHLPDVFDKAFHFLRAAKIVEPHFLDHFILIRYLLRDLGDAEWYSLHIFVEQDQFGCHGFDPFQDTRAALFELSDAFIILAAAFFEKDHILDALFGACGQVFHPLAGARLLLAQPAVLCTADWHLVFQRFDPGQFLADVGEGSVRGFQVNLAHLLGFPQRLLIGLPAAIHLADQVGFELLEQPVKLSQLVHRELSGGQILSQFLHTLRLIGQFIR